MNTYEHDIPQYASVRTLEIESEGKKTSQVGFFVHPMDRERHNREVQLPYVYRVVYEGTGIGRLSGIEEARTVCPEDMVFQTTEALPATGNGIHSVKVRFPTWDEIRDICRHPALTPLMDNYRKDHLPFDVEGNRIFSAYDWNYMTELAETNRLWQGEVHRYKKPISALISTVDETELKVDFNLAGAMKRIIDAGFRPDSYDSGTVSDHPNWRYTNTDTLGRYTQGEPMAPGERTFISFQGTDALGVVHNSDEKLQTVAEQALAAGWRVESVNDGKSTLRVCLPLATDGSTSAEIAEETRLWMDLQSRRGNVQPDSHEYMKQFTAEFQKTVERHGGAYNWTDEQVIRQWDNLSIRLAWRANLEQQTGLLNQKNLELVLLEPVKDKQLYQQNLKRRKAIRFGCQAQKDLLDGLLKKAMDGLARRHGFDGYESNIQGTGWKDVARTHERDLKHAPRLQAFQEEKEIVVEPLLKAIARNAGVEKIRLANEEQRYLQALYTSVHPGRTRNEKEQAEREQSRVSDLSIYHSGPESDLKFFIRCKIDGIQQPAMPMSRQDARIYLDLQQPKDLMDWIGKYFREALDRSQEQNRGMHR